MDVKAMSEEWSRYLMSSSRISFGIVENVMVVGEYWLSLA